MGAFVRAILSALKRSPLRRRTPLSPGQPPRHFQPLRREGLRGRARRRRWALITRAAIEAAGGVCEVRVPGVCLGRAVEGHHRLPRAQGGPDAAANCVPCCHACHRFITDNPAWAYERGFTLRRGARGCHA